MVHTGILFEDENQYFKYPMSESIIDQEAFEHYLHNFLKWLDVMTMDPVGQCTTWGNYNVAWKLVSDLKADAKAIIEMPGSYLSEYQKQQVTRFLTRLNDVPESLHVSATTITANQAAMRHPCWVPLREAASVLIQVLETAANRNNEYFHADNPKQTH
jgi:hypothetical protein